MHVWHGISFLCLLCLGGCGLLSVFSSDMDLDEVKIHAQPNANANDAVAVDVVLITEKKCLSAISGLTANGWFSSRAQILRDRPDCIKVKSWELVPEQRIDSDIDDSPVAAYVFARYNSVGDHRIRIANQFDTIHILLKKNDFVIREQESAP